VNFLKRYYDKVILLTLFVFFVGLMLSVLSKVEETSEIKAEDLKLPPRQADHNCVVPESDDFKIKEMWEKSAMFWKSAAKGDHVETASDLIKAEKLAACPYCSENEGAGKVLIPFSSFGGKCPNERCGKELPAPAADQQTLLITAGDSDGDGISNDDEKKYGLNPENPDDATTDIDGDGFSNRYEIAQKTAPNNSSDHPPLWHRLRVVDIRTVELPIKLQVVNTNNVSDKSKWDIQYNLPRTRRGKVRITSNFVVLGDEIQVDENDKRLYRIVDVRHVENATTAKTAATESKNDGNACNVGKFEVILKEVLDPDSKHQPDVIKMVTGETVHSSDLRPIFQDTGRPGAANIICRLGSDIEINRLVGAQNTSLSRYSRKYSEKYRVISADVRTKHVILGKINGVVEDESKLETVEITPEGKVTVADAVSETKENAGNTPDEE